MFKGTRGHGFVWLFIVHLRYAALYNLFSLSICNIYFVDIPDLVFASSGILSSTLEECDVILFTKEQEDRTAHDIELAQGNILFIIIP